MSVLATPRDRALILVIALAAVVVVAAFPLLPGLVGAGVLYVIVARPYRRFAAKIGSTTAIMLALVAAIAAVALPGGTLVALLANEAPDALQMLQRGAVLERMRSLHVGSLAVGAELARLGAAFGAWLPPQLLRIAGSATAALINLMIAFFGLYYLLRSGGRAWTAVRSYLPFSPKTADELQTRFYAMTEALLIGWVLVATVQGVVVAIGFAITDLPDPLFWGTVTGLASVLPVLGSGLVWAPAMIVLVVQDRYGAALIMLLTGTIAGSVDNFIRLFVYRRVSNIHPMITLVGAFAGVRLFGLLGLLVGPLAIVYLFELARVYRSEYATPRARLARHEA